MKLGPDEGVSEWVGGGATKNPPEDAMKLKGT